MAYLAVVQGPVERLTLLVVELWDDALLPAGGARFDCSLR